MIEVDIKNKTYHGLSIKEHEYGNITILGEETFIYGDGKVYESYLYRKINNKWIVCQTIKDCYAHTSPAPRTKIKEFTSQFGNIPISDNLKYIIAKFLTTEFTVMEY